MPFYIYIDESGTSSLNDHLQSTHFSLIGVVINQDRRESLKKDLDSLKQKYFGKKSYILHGSQLRQDLKKRRKSLADFAQDFHQLTKKHPFFILSTSVDKTKALNWSWQKTTILKRSYRHLLKNLVIFLIGKGVKGGIVAEASSVEKDIEIYKSFFHFIAHGIPSLKISSQDVKNHLTSVSFVTKNNNDAEEQLADFFGVCGKIESQIQSKSPLPLDILNQTLHSIWQQKLFHGRDTKNPSKKKIYQAIKAFTKLP